MFESEHDLEAFFLDFATPVQATPAHGDSFTFQGIFDDAFFSPEMGEMTLDSSSPRLTARVSDTARLHRGDLLSVATAAYSIIEIQPDADRQTATIILAHE